MPELSRFYGIITRMYFNDHLPPHFHAYYSEYKAISSTKTLAHTAGSLPARALGLVIEWASLHQAELAPAWERTRAAQPPGTIAPLR